MAKAVPPGRERRGQGDAAQPEAGARPAIAVHRLSVGAPAAGERLDKYLVAQFPNVSRSRLQQWIASGDVLREGVPGRARDLVREGDRIEVHERECEHQTSFRPEPVPVPIVWQDESLIVVNKPAGLVVHPGAGNWSGTLLNGLLAYDEGLSRVPRAGIVHRLDAGTSGLMVVARTAAVQLELVRQLAARTVAREYWALVAGEIAPSLTIRESIDRDPRNPLRFHVSRAAAAKPARTFVRRRALWHVDPAASGAAVRRPDASGVAVSWIVCRLDTGRTHQIRVHLEFVGHPLLGDPLYRRHLPAALAKAAWMARPALHAVRLELRHPVSGETMGWSCAPPPDMAELMRRLGATARQLRPPERLAIELPAAARSEAEAEEEFDDGD